MTPTPDLADLEGFRGRPIQHRAKGTAWLRANDPRPVRSALRGRGFRVPRDHAPCGSAAGLPESADLPARPARFGYSRHPAEADGVLRPSMINNDGPTHTCLRQSVSRASTPRRIAGLRERLVHVARETIDSSRLAESATSRSSPTGRLRRDAHPIRTWPSAKARLSASACTWPGWDHRAVPGVVAPAARHPRDRGTRASALAVHERQAPTLRVHPGLNVRCAAGGCGRSARRPARRAGPAPTTPG